jgi:adenylate cyclase
MNFFKLIKQAISTRKIQFDIVTIFVSLFILFSIITTFFNYAKYRQNTLDLSKQIMDEVNHTLINKISNIKVQSEFLAEATRGLITSERVLSLNHTDLIYYLLNVLRFNSLTYSIEIETLNGNLLSAIDLTRIPFPIAESLPTSAKYAIRFIDRSEPVPTETWVFKDTDLDTLETRSISPAIYDLRINSWFESTANWPHIHWTNLYQSLLGNLEVVVSAPAIDNEDKVIGVVAVKLSLDQLSNFFSHQQIGRSGRVFILDQVGDLSIPSIKPSEEVTSDIPYSLITAVYDHYQKTHINYTILTEQNIVYLTNVIDFPVSFENHWFVIILVPQKDFIGTLMRTQAQTLALSLTLLIIFGIIVYLSSKHISKPIVELSEQVNRIQHFDFRDTPPLRSHIIEIITLDSSLTAMRVALRSFGRYVPKEIVKTLLMQGKEIALGGEKRDLTIMFSDISDFTSYSETFSSETLLPALSDYFDRLSKIILTSEGTIDKFVGDGIMAFWGAPQVVTDQAYKACCAALQCHLASDKELKTGGMPQWHTRFGIHSGEVIVGNIGTSERMNYTIIGDVVNTASRLEGINKIYRSSIIISDTVKDKVWKRFVTRPLDLVAIRGKKNKLMIHELIGTVEQGTPISATQEEIELTKTFTEAYFTFHEGKLDLAKNQFSSILQHFPDDIPSQLYLKRIEEEQHPQSPSS